MPKLTNHTFTLKTDDDHKHSFQSEIYVCTEGQFSCTVPEYLVESLATVAKAQTFSTRRFDVQKLKVNHRAYAPSKADLLAYVNEAHRQHHTAEVTTDLIICYDWFAEVSYWQNPDGSMTANGSMPDAAKRDDRGNGGNWANHRLRNGSTIHANSTTQHFSVGIYAAIHKRTSYKRTSGTTITWERITSHDSNENLGEWGKRLTGICGLSAPKSPEHLRQMPYAETSAQFFYESMMAMCEMGRRFKVFFEDESNVLAAIEGRAPGLLTGPNGPQQ